MKRIWVLAFLACSAGCATQAELAGITARATIPQQCRFIGKTPQIAELGTDKNLRQIVNAMGGGNIIIETGRYVPQGLLALAATWWGDLYDCDNPEQFRSANGVRILSGARAHPVDPGVREASLGVRVSSNPDAVRGCEFIVNVNDLTAGELTQGTYPVRQAVLRYNTASAGGNTVLLTSDPHTGEAYRCIAPLTRNQGSPANDKSAAIWGVKVVENFDALKGCTFIAAADFQLKCQRPDNEPKDCLVWQAAQKGGNTLLLASDRAHIYACPAQ